ncbi:DUF2130 domain-containing protein [Candidatus Saccharibacteria bacterium]|nr:DUF2130 domain-containing protein [Candidatus Saccharibacteria bacterium]
MTITCNHCGREVELTEALTKDIQKTVMAAQHEKHQAELTTVRAEAEAGAKRLTAAAADQARKTLDVEKALLQQRSEADIEILKKQLTAEAENTRRKTFANQELTTQALKADAEAAKNDSNGLRTQLTDMMKLLRDEKQARANVELEAQKKFNAEESKIRDESTRLAEERFRLKIAENEKKLADTQKALVDAQRKANQGSQQNQGEVLELDLENRLREEFPFDEIQEVKKGARGADMKQLVRNQSGINCGMLLWETKNGKWQPAWVTKFKADIREANANIGVIVSQELPHDIQDFKQLENNVWVASPSFATRLAVALRAIILQVDAANKMNTNKDTSMEYLYQYLVGPEFRHRVEAIVENYGTLQAEIEKEKRAAALRWAHQEKAIRNVIDNTIGMYGDLQGITNRALPSIKTLELDIGEDDVDSGSSSQSSLL